MLRWLHCQVVNGVELDSHRVYLNKLEGLWDEHIVCLWSGRARHSNDSAQQSRRMVKETGVSQVHLNGSHTQQVKGNNESPITRTNRAFRGGPTTNWVFDGSSLMAIRSIEIKSSESAHSIVCIVRGMLQEHEAEGICDCKAGGESTRGQMPEARVSAAWKLLEGSG